jgi:hypothetical protein
MLCHAGWRRKRAFAARSRQSLLCCLAPGGGAKRYRPKFAGKIAPAQSFLVSAKAPEPWALAKDVSSVYC